MTYSIAALDERTGTLGVAVQSHFFSVGTRVPFVERGVGAIATQAFASPHYGFEGLVRLRAGESPADALAALVAADEGSGFRQVGIVDAQGRSVAHTGASCLDHAGHRTGPGFAAQGNMLAAPGTWDAMADAFTGASGHLAERLVTALDAGEAAGGDARGRQSAALLVETADGHRVELRVEDHPEPLRELRRLLALRRAYDDLGRAILGDGLLIGDPARVTPQALDESLAALERAEGVLGANPEATFWRAVLLARAGRGDEARDAFARAYAVEPRLAGVAASLPRAGFLPDGSFLPTDDDARRAR